MKFKTGDRVELLESAFDPSAHDPYAAWSLAPDYHRHSGDSIYLVKLSPGMCGEVVVPSWGGGPKVRFDAYPDGFANVREAHLRKQELYGNEEE
jgi:hypothetical protein